MVFGSMVRSAADSLRRRQQFDFCDGLRALAVLWVCADHGMGHVRLFLPGMGWRLYLKWWPVALPASGEAGVDIFLVLSGFLIGGVLQHEVRETGRVALGSFCLRRAFRILPAILSAMVLTTAKNAAVGEPLECPSNWLNTLLTTKPGDCMGHTWSVAVELQLYMATPLLMWLSSFLRSLLEALLPKRQMSGSSITVALCSCVWAACAVARLHLVFCGHWTTRDRTHLYFNTHYRCSTYIAGVLVGVLVSEANAGGYLKGPKRLHVRILATLSMAASFAVLACACVYGGDLSSVLDDEVVEGYQKNFPTLSGLHKALLRPFLGLAVACILFCCAAGLAPLTSKILTLSAWRPIAGLSYSMYLLQFVGFQLLARPFLQLLGDSLVSAPIWLGMLAAYTATALFILGCVPLAFVNYAFIERPGIKAGRQVAAMLDRCGEQLRGFFLGSGVGQATPEECMVVVEPRSEDLEAPCPAREEGTQQLGEEKAKAESGAEAAAIAVGRGEAREVLQLDVEAAETTFIASRTAVLASVFGS